MIEFAPAVDLDVYCRGDAEFDSCVCTHRWDDDARLSILIVHFLNYIINQLFTFINVFVNTVYFVF